MCVCACVLKGLIHPFTEHAPDPPVLYFASDDTNERGDTRGASTSAVAAAAPASESPFFRPLGVASIQSGPDRGGSPVNPSSSPVTGGSGISSSGISGMRSSTRLLRGVQVRQQAQQDHSGSGSLSPLPSPLPPLGGFINSNEGSSQQHQEAAPLLMIPLPPTTHANPDHATDRCYHCCRRRLSLPSFCKSVVIGLPWTARIGIW